MRLINKRLIAVIHDASMAGVALFLAILARYGFEKLPPVELIISWLAVFIGIAAAVFKLSGLGRGLWRFASLADLRAIILASIATVFAFVLVMFLATRL
ncbi:MAG: polysaccharide biosynthesis protein, partial [Hyphomicrobiales bacterium]